MCRLTTRIRFPGRAANVYVAWGRPLIRFPRLSLGGTVRSQRVKDFFLGRYFVEVVRPPGDLYPSPTLCDERIRDRGDVCPSSCVALPNVCFPYRYPFVEEERGANDVPY